MLMGTALLQTPKNCHKTNVRTRTKWKNGFKPSFALLPKTFHSTSFGSSCKERYFMERPFPFTLQTVGGFAMMARRVLKQSPYLRNLSMRIIIHYLFGVIALSVYGGQV